MAKQSLREQQQELTRELIFQAIVDVVLEEGVQAFTVQRVAERAGVSARTVYRHFPTRQALLDAIGDWSAEQNAQHGLAPPTSAAEFPEQARRIFRSWDEDEDAVRAFVILRLLGGLQPRERTERVQRIAQLIDEWAPHAPVEVRQHGIRTIRALYNTVTWTQMRTDLGITGAEAGDAVAYAIQLVLDDLKRASDEVSSRQV
jgi:AcrR family transcriptional regulator